MNKILFKNKIFVFPFLFEGRNRGRPPWTVYLQALLKL